MSSKWEYMHTELDFSWSEHHQMTYAQKELSRLGSDGWELISIFPSVAYAPDRGQMEAVFKRQKND